MTTFAIHGGNFVLSKIESSYVHSPEQRSPVSRRLEIPEGKQSMLCELSAIWNVSISRRVRCERFYCTCTMHMGTCSDVKVLLHV